MELTRDQILGAADLAPSKLPVPEWGGDVWLKPMTAGQRGEWEAFIAAGDNGARAEVLKASRARLAVMCLCDENGTAIFREDDIPALQAKSALALERVGLKAMKLNRLSAKDIAELAKN